MKKFALVLLFLVSFVPMQEEVSLMIVAHPDDEILWGGASLSHHRYVVVCMTNGDHPIRSVEFERVMMRCGKESMMFSYPDKVNGKRSDWQSIQKAMRHELQTLITSRKWKRIVTHNPNGEYGHAHHRILSKLVTDISEEIGYDELYYFHHYYRKNQIHRYLPLLSFSEIYWKQEMMRDYVSQAKVNEHLKHMYGYEELIPKKRWINCYSD